MTSPQDGPGLLGQRCAELKAKISVLGDFRQGSLVERYRRCGKSNCHCATEGAGHGPSWSLTRAVEGKTITKVIPDGPAVERTRAQLTEHKKFRALTRELLEINEQICDSKIEAPLQSEATSQEAAKKRGSPAPSRAKSSPKSKR